MRGSAKLDWAVLALFVVISVVLGRTQTGHRQSGTIDPFSGIVQRMVLPPARVLGATSDAVHDTFADIGSVPSLKKRIAQLEQQQKAHSLYDARVSRLQTQVAELRKQMRYDALPGKRRIPADIVGFFPRENRATLSAGESEGVQPGLPVVAGDGLVGLIQSVATHTSQVQLLSSPREQLTIGAMVARDIPAVGLLYGDAPDRLVLELFDTSLTVKVGDVVTTSGYSPKIPRGLPIGTVVQVVDDPDFGTRQAQVFPNVHIGAVREVTILR